MRKQSQLFVICASIVLLLTLWLFHGKSRFTELHKSSLATDTNAIGRPSSLGSTLGSNSMVSTNKHVQMRTPLGQQNIRLFKSTNYPPQTKEEEAMWEWWDAMEKSDPNFQWKMPIEFYGKVIDQFDQPVERAKVMLNWTTVIGPIPDPKTNVFTDANGLFEVVGIQGKILWIAVGKQGYLRSTGSVASFEYAAFYEENFHVPDPNNPVIFRLQKLLSGEPMYKFLPYGDIVVGGPAMILDVERGRVSGQGDLAFSVSLGPATNRSGTDFNITMRGLNGAGFIFSDEEFLLKAPETGYQYARRIEVRLADPLYSPFQTLRFYVRTGTGKYAAGEARIELGNKRKEARFSAIVYYNPSGSRNLEFDQNKWINR